jgi:ABC-2 type transporter
MSTQSLTAMGSTRSYRGTRTATEMFVRELARRWPTVLFMIFMPASYFLVSYLTNDPEDVVPARIFTGDGHQMVPVLDRDFKALYLAVLGISVTSSFAALTTVRGSAEMTRRLRLVGFRSSQLLSARLVVLGLISLLSTGAFLAIFLPLVEIRWVALVTAALLLVGLLGVGVGTLVGLLLQREFEAAMIVIAVAGVQMALGRGGADAEKYLVYWPAVEALKTAAFSPTAEVGRHLGQAGLYVVVLFALSYLVWNLRTRIWRR